MKTTSTTQYMTIIALIALAAFGIATATSSINTDPPTAPVFKDIGHVDKQRAAARFALQIGWESRDKGMTLQQTIDVYQKNCEPKSK